VTFRRSIKLLSLAFVPLVGLWVYALSQSVGEVRSLMAALPDDASADGGPRTPRTAAHVPPRPAERPTPDSSVTERAEQTESAGDSLRYEPPELADAPFPVEIGRAGAAPLVPEDNYDFYLANEFPPLRSFDPYVYEQVIRQQRESLRTLPNAESPGSSLDSASTDSTGTNSEGRPLNPLMVPGLND